jgi:RNA polymerase sigma factor (sigma-70 family)
MAKPQTHVPFQKLIDAHASVVAGFLRGMLAPHDVDDAIQETFIAAMRAYPSFDGANPRAWLLTIARRKAIDEYRASSRRPGSLASPDEIAASSSRSEGSAEDGEALWAAVAGLPPKQRAAIVLRFALDLRYREVGEAIGCTEAAARRSVHEGISRLRDGYATATEGEVRR